MRDNEFSEEVREVKLAECNDRCEYCRSSSNLHFHHMKYRSKGGSGMYKNCAVLCDTCHELTHSGDPDYEKYRTAAWEDE